MWQSRKSERPGRIEITGPGNLPEAPPKKVTIDEEGLIALSSMDGVPLIFLNMPQIRERQADLLQNKLRAIADASKGRLAVSMSETVVMTSAGVNALLAVHLRCESAGGHLAVFALSKELQRMFRITKLDRKLVIVDTARQAVDSFSSEKKRGFLRSALSWGRQDAA
jgi:anti-anti-sigma factor